MLKKFRKLNSLLKLNKPLRDRIQLQILPLKLSNLGFLKFRKKEIEANPYSQLIDISDILVSVGLEEMNAENDIL